MQPPLTPMIDVTFQLIIFFLIAFQLREREGLIPSSLPRQGVGVVKEDSLTRPVYLRVSPQGQEGEHVLYQIEMTNFMSSDPEELYQALVSKKQGASEKLPVVIRADGDARWQYVVEAFNAAVRAKLRNVAFAPSG